MLDAIARDVDTAIHDDQINVRSVSRVARAPSVELKIKFDQVTVEVQVAVDVFGAVDTLCWPDFCCAREGVERAPVTAWSRGVAAVGAPDASHPPLASDGALV